MLEQGMDKGTHKDAIFFRCSDLEEFTSLFLEPVFIGFSDEPGPLPCVGINGIRMRDVDWA